MALKLDNLLHQCHLLSYKYIITNTLLIQLSPLASVPEREKCLWQTNLRTFRVCLFSFGNLRAMTKIYFETVE